MIELEVRCKTCGRMWIPTYQDTRAGTWRICPACRDGPASDHTSTAPKPLNGAGNALQGHIDESDEKREEAAP